MNHSLSFYRTIFDYSMEAILCASPDGIIFGANPAACNLLLRSEAELCKVGRAGILDPSSQLSDFLEERARNGTAHGKLIFIRGDGTRFSGEVSSAEFVDEEGEIRTTLVIRDLTEIINSKLECISAEEKFRAIVEQSLVGVYILDGSVVDYANSRATEIYGFTPAEMCGKSFLPYILDEDKDSVIQTIERITRGETNVGAITFRVVRKDGKEVAVSSQAVRAFINNKPFLIGINQDITAQVKAENDVRTHIIRLERAVFSTVDVVSKMMDMRDPYTSGHEQRMAIIAVKIAAEMGLDENIQTGLRIAGGVHDVGKISVPAEILSMPRKLTNVEFELVKTHAQTGFEILKGVDFSWPVAQITLQHHERMDGSGYPQGLKGDEIILEARIAAVADVVESMSSHRPYRPALGIGSALEEIELGRGSKYDPIVVDACLKLFQNEDNKLPT